MLIDADMLISVLLAAVHLTRFSLILNPFGFILVWTIDANVYVSVALFITEIVL
jgi:hypothetical protein